MGMVMTMAPMASASYYLNKQRSHRHPNDYYTGGEERDGVWFNPAGLFGLTDRGKIDSRDFHRLHNGLSPLDKAALIRSARSSRHSSGHDFTFSVDKSLSALWAIADSPTRAVIEEIVDEAARFAIEQTMVGMCSTTRVRRAGEKKGKPGEIEVLAADLIGAQFPHGKGRAGDPQLEVRFLLFNVAKAHEDGKYRAVNMHPMYQWQKAAGAAFGAYVAWEMGKRLGVRFEHYGENNEFQRVAGIPQSQTEGWSRLVASWSKRSAAMLDMARDIGPGAERRVALMQKISVLTRGPYVHDTDPAVRHERWRDWAAKYIDRAMVLSCVRERAHTVTEEERASLEADAAALPGKLTKHQAVVGFPTVMEGVFNLLGVRADPGAFDGWISRVVKQPGVIELTPRASQMNSPEGKAGMQHTRAFTTEAALEKDPDFDKKLLKRGFEFPPDLPQQTRETNDKVTGLRERQLSHFPRGRPPRWG